MKDIEVESSITNQLMTDRTFLAKDHHDMYYIPYLLILGVLYCPSNPQLKSQKFYELC